MAAQQRANSTGTVLVVDDHLVLRRCLREALELAGYEVTTACNGLEGLAVLNAMDTPPDLILTDLCMDLMDGRQFLRSARADTRWQKVPFLFISGQSSSVEKVSGVTCLPKPFTLQQLATAVASALTPRAVG